MLKEKSSSWARLKYLYVLPVAAIAVTAFARPEVSNVAEEISAVKVNDLTAIVETKVAEYGVTDTVKQAEPATVFTVVEEMPEFPGGIQASLDYIRKNIHYPEAARKAGIQGRVTVQFVVDAEGNVVLPRIMRSEHKELEAEAIRLVKAMLKWKPGKQKGKAVAVKYTFPIVFRLNDADAKKDEAKVSIQSWDDGNAPLCIVNGKEVDIAVMAALNPDKIENMSVLKDKAALETYGEKGKNGVLLITLKENHPTMAAVGVGNVYNKMDKATSLDIDKADVYLDFVKVDRERGKSGRPGAG